MRFSLDNKSPNNVALKKYRDSGWLSQGTREVDEGKGA
jgi:hypothetical protein